MVHWTRLATTLPSVNANVGLNYTGCKLFFSLTVTRWCFWGEQHQRCTCIWNRILQKNRTWLYFNWTLDKWNKTKRGYRAQLCSPVVEKTKQNKTLVATFLAAASCISLSLLIFGKVLVVSFCSFHRRSAKYSLGELASGNGKKKKKKTRVDMQWPGMWKLSSSNSSTGIVDLIGWTSNFSPAATFTFVAGNGLKDAGLQPGVPLYRIPPLGQRYWSIYPIRIQYHHSH